MLPTHGNAPLNLFFRCLDMCFQISHRIYEWVAQMTARWKEQREGTGRCQEDSCQNLPGRGAPGPRVVTFGGTFKTFVHK